jgi:hypothetical protein
MPATAVQTFSALFPFGTAVPSSALDAIRELPVSVVVMIGIPDHAEHLDQVLQALVDPRRELLLVVDANEYAAASAAADRFRRRARARLSGPLLESAASFGTYHESLSGIQVVHGSRAMAPAAVQMLLDLAALRRVNPDDVPERIDGRPLYVRTTGNATGIRRAQTLFRASVGFDELLERYRELHDHTPELAAGQLRPLRRQLMTLNVPDRPVVLLPSDAPVLLAAIPLARHLGAIVLTASDEGVATCVKLAPSDVYATQEAAAHLVGGPWNVHLLPSEPSAIAVAFHERASQNHADLLASLPSQRPELLANRELLVEMAPAGYVVLVTDSPGERAWAFLAANYAAALSAPLLMVDGALPQRDARLSAAAQLLDGTRWRTSDPSLRDLGGDGWQPLEVAPITVDVLGPAAVPLEKMAPAYIGFMSPRADFPIELVGDPPLSTRYAIGRLGGPDLDSTAQLVVRAALAEDVVRPARISAVIADAGMAVASRPLPGARDEADAVRDRLAAEADIDTTFVEGDGDLFDFVAGLSGAGLVHFAGHGLYDQAMTARSGLVFRSGVLTAGGLLEPFTATPIMFSNACESGILDRDLQTSDGGRARSGWTGLAASFLLNGAANYLGSLWPIYDETSRALAEEFYTQLCAGTPVGEALRRARLKVYAEGDSTWAAFVLFGCPRNRLRPARPAG